MCSSETTKVSVNTSFEACLLAAEECLTAAAATLPADRYPVMRGMLYERRSEVERLRRWDYEEDRDVPLDH